MIISNASVVLMLLLSSLSSPPWAAAQYQPQSQLSKFFRGRPDEQGDKQHHRHALDAANCDELSIKQCSATSDGNDLWCRTECDIVIYSNDGGDSFVSDEATMNSGLSFADIQISGDGNHLWGIKSHDDGVSGDVYYRDIGNGGNWMLKNGMLIEIGVNYDGTGVWGINHLNEVWVWYPQSSSFGQESTAAQELVDISVGGLLTNAYAIGPTTSNGHGWLYRYDTTTNGFVEECGWVKDVAVDTSVNGNRLYGISDTGDKIYYRDGLCGKAWNEIEFNEANTIASKVVPLGIDTVIVINENGRLFKKIITDNNKWITMNSSIRITDPATASVVVNYFPGTDVCFFGDPYWLITNDRKSRRFYHDSTHNSVSVWKNFYGWYLFYNSDNNNWVVAIHVQDNLSRPGSISSSVNDGELPWEVTWPSNIDEVALC